MSASTAFYAPTAIRGQRDAAAPGAGSRLRRFLRGRPDDAAWVRPALLALLVGTALLYLIDLGASGWANTFYSAAVQAGTQSWKAFFFGSSDAANSITVDKPPAALWVAEISARIFGVNSWSILVPEALMGVATVGTLYATVRRWFGAQAGLLAGAVLALTPVAALMFRFNNPDALLVLLLTASFYFMTRALEDGRTSWLSLAAVCIGTAFLTKMMQAFLVVPAMVGVFLAFGPGLLRRRFVQLLWAGLALAIAGGWWMVAVSLTPAADRPYIGGSQDNSIWNLLFGYNGFGRLSGNESGSVGGGTTSGSKWGTTGLTRLFGSEMGGQISWLLPAALVLLVGGFILRGRASRTDRPRAALALWGGWLLVTGLVFSLGQGIIHPYYTVALAPAIAAIIGIGGAVAWNVRTTVLGRIVLGIALAAGSSWGYVLLARTPSFLPWLRVPVLITGLLAALAVAVPSALARRWTVIALLTGILAGIAGPAAYAVQTASVAHTGAIPSAGPTVSGGMGGMGGGRAGFGGFGGGGRGGGGFAGTAPTTGTGAGTGIASGAGRGSATVGAPSFGGGPGGGNTGGGNTGGGNGIGGLLNGSTSNAALTAALKSGDYTWAAATIGSNNAAGYQLASGRSVMPIGGFNGTDPSPTLAQFEALVTAGKIHYFIPGSTGGGSTSGTTDTATQITQWVEDHYSSTTIGGTTVYDLTATARA